MGATGCARWFDGFESDVFEVDARVRHDVLLPCHVEFDEHGHSSAAVDRAPVTSHADLAQSHETVGPTTRVSPFPFVDSIDRLLDVIAARHLVVFDIVDHAALAREAGMTLRETRVVVFGNPTAGTPLMDAHPTMALDLPLRVLVWEETDHCRTFFTYWSASDVSRHFGLDVAGSQAIAAPAAIVDEVLKGRP